MKAPINSIFNMTVPALVALTLCNCHMTSPEYTALIDQAKTTGSRNDVVGTWYNRSDTRNALVNMSSEGMMIVHSNGTATMKATMSGRTGFMPMPSETQGTKNWSYKGNGVWEASSGFGHKETWRLANGKLLVESKANTGGLGNFIGRSVMVNAKDQKAMEDAFRRDNTTIDSAWGL